MAKPRHAEQRTITCYFCGHTFGVSGKAISTSCPKCFKKLVLDDLVIKVTQSLKTLQTCGKITVEKRGRIIAHLVQAQEGVDIRGKMESRKYRGGPVVIRETATWKGDCAAPSVLVKKGGGIVGGLFSIGVGEESVYDVVLNAPSSKKNATTTPEQAVDKSAKKPAKPTARTRRKKKTTTKIKTPAPAESVSEKTITKASVSAVTIVPAFTGSSESTTPTPSADQTAPSPARKKKTRAHATPAQRRRRAAAASEDNSASKPGDVVQPAAAAKPASASTKKTSGAAPAKKKAISTRAKVQVETKPTAKTGTTSLDSKAPPTDNKPAVAKKKTATADTTKKKSATKKKRRATPRQRRAAASDD